MLLLPGDITTRTGGYGYDREMVAGLRDLGWSVDIAALDHSFPFPSSDARADAARVLAGVPDGTLVLADGLAFGAMAEEAEREADRLRFVALVHHPLALETGLAPEEAARLFATERRALQTARGVVVTSDATVASLAPYEIAASRVAVVLPGTHPAPLAAGTRGRGPFRREAAIELLAVASLTPRKGYDVLFDALGARAHAHWHLTVAGSPHLSPDIAAQLFAQVDRLGLAARVTFAGELGETALAALYDRADVFVLPTRHEGYGMAVAEAVARGLPVISTPTGAIPDLVDGSNGMLVPIDDVDALAGALALIEDDDARARLAAGAVRRRAALPTWQDAARAMSEVLRRYAVDVRV